MNVSLIDLMYHWPQWLSTVQVLTAKPLLHVILNLIRSYLMLSLPLKFVG